MKILTVIPTQEELDFFVQGCAGQGLTMETSALGRMPITYLPGLGLTLAQGGLGKAQFAVQMQHLIDSGEGWDAVICAGAAGALDDRLAVGDVVIGTQTIEYDIRNKFGQPLLPRFDSAESIVEDFRRLKLEDASFKLYFGAIASGDEDIVDVGRRREVRDLTGALTNAWEGAGGARASYFSQVPFVEIRGISDGADETAARDFEKNLPTTMGNVALVITKWAGQNVGKRRIDGL
jgi:adenosylhomocysteine nucleosidase